MTELGAYDDSNRTIAKCLLAERVEMTLRVSVFQY